MDCSRCWVTVGAVLGGLAVTLGAFAAHGLDTYFAEKYQGETRVKAGVELPAAQKYLADFKTGADYQMIHALALIGVGLLLQKRSSKSLQVAAWSFVLGVLLFSGSLYILTTTGQRWWGMVTPLGGLLLIVGWVAFAIGACPCGSSAES